MREKGLVLWEKHWLGCNLVFWSFAIEDGMDQSKWAIPRCRHQTLTKQVAKYERPRTKLQGVWLHGVILALYVIEVRQSADGSLVAECLSKALDKMKEICDAMGRPYPKRLFLWAPWRSLSQRFDVCLLWACRFQCFGLEKSLVVFYVWRPYATWGR